MLFLFFASEQNVGMQKEMRALLHIPATIHHTHVCFKGLNTLQTIAGKWCAEGVRIAIVNAALCTICR